MQFRENGQVFNSTPVPPVALMSGTASVNVVRPLELLPRDIEREGGLRSGDSLPFSSWLPISSMPLERAKRKGGGRQREVSSMSL